MEGSGAKFFLFIGISHRRSLEHRDFKQTQLILIKPGSGKSVNYWGLFSLDFAFTTRKLTYPCLWQVCIWELWLRKSSQNDAATLVHLEREREQGPNWEPASPCTLCSLGPETDWNVNWHCTTLRTTARRDFSSARVVCNSSKTGLKQGGSAGWRCDWASYEKTSKWMSKRHFWGHVRGSKSFGRRLCRNWSIFEKSNR